MLNYECKDCQYFNIINPTKGSYTCQLDFEEIKPTDEACYEILPLTEPDDGYDIYEE